MSARTPRAYYPAIDDGRYDDLCELLAPDFVHDRPDRTFEGREAFVEFMRDDRPRTETTHVLDGVYVEKEEKEFAVRGRLLDGDGDPLFGFVDVHTIADDAITRVKTYTD